MRVPGELAVLASNLCVQIQQSTIHGIYLPYVGPRCLPGGPPSHQHSDHQVLPNVASSAGMRICSHNLLRRTLA